MAGVNEPHEILPDGAFAEKTALVTGASRGIGRAIAAEIRGEVAAGGAELAAGGGRPPKLVAVLVGDNPASKTYVSSKAQACREVGMASDILHLPAAIERVRWLRSPHQAHGRLCALVRPGSEDGAFDARVIDESGAVLVALEGYRTIELPVVLEEERLAPLRAAMK